MSSMTLAGLALADPSTVPPPLSPAGAGALLLAAIAVDWTAPARPALTRVDGIRDLAVGLAATAGLACLLATWTGWLHTSVTTGLAAPASTVAHGYAATVAAVCVTGLVAATAVAAAAVVPALAGRRAPTGAPGLWTRARIRPHAVTSWPLWICAAAPALLAGGVPGAAGYALRGAVWGVQAVWSIPFAITIGTDRTGTAVWSAIVLLVWLVSIGWRPLKIDIPSPTTGGRARTATAGNGSDSGSDSDSGRPVATGRVEQVAAGVWRSADSPVVPVSVRPRRAVAPWWRRMWAGHVPPVTAPLADRPTGRRTDLHAWIRSNLAAGRRPTDIVRLGARSWPGCSTRTMWRELAKVREQA